MEGEAILGDVGHRVRQPLELLTQEVMVAWRGEALGATEEWLD